MGPTAAFGATRRLVQASWASTWEEHLARESVTIARAATSAEGLEGLAAFLGKRPPDYRWSAETPVSHLDTPTTKKHPNA